MNKTFIEEVKLKLDETEAKKATLENAININSGNYALLVGMSGAYEHVIKSYEDHNGDEDLIFSEIKNELELTDKAKKDMQETAHPDNRMFMVLVGMLIAYGNVIN